MRGRTNASGGGEKINADLQNFEVYAGQNISAGDPVEFWQQYAGGLELGSSSYKGIRKIFKLSDGRFFCVFLSTKGSSYIVKLLNDNFTKESISTSFDLKNIFQIDDDTFLNVDFKWNNNSKKYVCVIKLIYFDTSRNVFENREITFNTDIYQGSANSSWRANGNWAFFDRDGEYLYIILDALIDSGYEYNGLVTLKIKITGNSYSTYSFENISSNIIYLSSKDSYNGDCFVDGVIVDGGYIISYIQEGKKQVFYYLSKDDFYTRENSGISADVRFGSSTFGLTVLGQILAVKNNYLIYLYDDNQYLRIKKVQIMNYSIACMTFTEYDPVLIFSRSSKRSGIGAGTGALVLDNTSQIVRGVLGFSEALVNNKYVLRSCVFDYNIDQNTAVLYIPSDYFACANSSIIKMEQRNIAFVLSDTYQHETNAIMLVKIDQSTMAIVDGIENKKYVKEATDNFYIQGIAKDSGSSGEIIRVYVPKLNL